MMSKKSAEEWRQDVKAAGNLPKGTLPVPWELVMDFCVELDKRITKIEEYIEERQAQGHLPVA